MLVILDRDGVINYDSESYICSPEDWRPIPGSLEAIARLNNAGCNVVVATNQSGIGRGYYTLSTLKKIHEKMETALAAVGGGLAGVYFCPHLPTDDCGCRKPKPGLLLQIKADFPDDFSEAIFVGDSLRDLEAAQAAGCKAALVKTGNGAKVAEVGRGLEGVSVYADLGNFAQECL